jgi:hypothetical protein
MANRDNGESPADGGLNGKILYKQRVSIAMFGYWKVNGGNCCKLLAGLATCPLMKLADINWNTCRYQLVCPT